MKILILCLFLSTSLLHRADSAASKSSNEDGPKLGIVNGLNATSDEGKHAVQIWYKEEFSCGGSLIDTTTVISAAHCTYNFSENVFLDPKGFTVRYGTHMLRPPGVEPKNDIKVKWIKAHPNYSFAKTLLTPGFVAITDISIFKLSEPVVEDENVSFIELQQTELRSTSDAFTLFGFGRTNPLFSRDFSTILPARLPDRLQKELTFNATEEIYSDFIWRSRITPGTLITRNPNSTLCKGDSGSGLVYKKKLVAVVSVVFGLTCDPGSFEGFAPIAFPENWNFIQQNRA